MKKVLVIHNVLSPTRVHQFNEMNKFYLEKEIAFKVIFLNESDKNRHWKNFDINFDYEILKSIAIRFGRKDLYTFFISKNIYQLLNKEIPDKIVCFNWDHLAAYISNYWARKNKKEFILWSGSTAYEKSWRRTLFSPLVKYLVKKSHSCIGDGTRHRDYLIQLGAKPENVEVFYFQVDVDYFEKKLNSLSTEQKNQFKIELGIATQKIIFFNGQLIERKGIFELLDGFKLYQQKDLNVSLLILGKGREREKMKKIILDKNIKNVFFADFVQYEDVYKYYSVSDILILPSREEAWGLVVNEAMASGLPVITTYETGSSDDLIEEGINGFKIKSNCPECISAAIGKIYERQLNTHNNSKQKITAISVIEMIKKLESLRFKE